MTEIAMTLLLSLHLLCVNAAAGGPLVAAWLDWRGTRGDAAAAGTARYLAGCSVGGLLFGAILGDYDGLYDPNDFNDRLLLGLRSSMS